MTKPKPKKLPPPDWIDIKMRCTLLKQTYAFMETIYDVKEKTVRNHASSEQWKADAQEVRQIIEERIIERVAEKAADTFVDRYIRLEEKALDVLEAHLNEEVIATPASQMAAIRITLQRIQAQVSKQELEPVEPLTIDVVAEWPDEDKLQFLLTGQKPIK
jgi:hypothetical protein